MMEIQLFSLPLLLAATISTFVSVFYFYLFGRLLAIVREKNRSYLVFAILNICIATYLFSFGVLLNSASDLDKLNLFNRISIIAAQLSVVLTFHLIKMFFGDRKKTDLITYYCVGFLFMFLCFFDTPIFLEKKFYRTSSYYMGLNFGPLFQIWGLYILAVFGHMMAYLIARFVRQGDVKTRRTILFLFAACVVWSALGIMEALTAVHLLDLPPLSWIGSLLLVLSFSILLVRQIEHLYLNIAKLYNEVIHDSLTGIFSRRYLEIKLAELIAGLRRHNRVVYLGIVDVDDFKLINDNYGHLMGDKVLQAITRTLKSRLRPTDDVGRYGGDEFIFILENVKAEQDIFIVIDRIRDEISRLKFQHEKDSFGISCSFGLTRFDQSAINGDLSWERIIAKADEALYRSKMSGKNAVQIISLTAEKGEVH